MFQSIHHGVTNPAGLTYVVHSTVNQNQPVLGARRSSGMERKLLMEIKVLDCPEASPARFGVSLNKAELFTSDLRAAFVMTYAKDGLMLSLAF